jgi:tetratricopeptide (TPR) repeat protein
MKKNVEDMNIASRAARFFAILALIAYIALAAGPGPAMAETGAERSMLLVRQGGAALLRGKYERAIRAYDEALGYEKLSPVRKASIYSDRGVALWRLRRAEQALGDFDKAIELNPQFPQVYNNKGNALLELDRKLDAISAYGKAIELAPSYGVAYNNRGNARLEAGETEEAIEDFSAAIRYLPINAVPYNGRGRAHLKAGRSFAALRDFSRAVRLNRNYGMVFLSRARAYVNVREYGRAVKDFSRAIAIAGKEPQLYFERGRAYQRNSDYGPAIADYSKTIDLAPGHAAAFSWRGLCFAFLKKYEKAMADANKAAELDPASFLVYLNRGEIYKRMGLLDKALEDLNTALEIDKENARALKLTGQIYEIRKDKEKALAFYRRSLARDRFMEGSRNGVRRLTGKLPPYGDKPDEEAVAGWQVEKRKDDRYYIYNNGYPYFYGDIEIYGKGEPRLLEWKPLKGVWKGIGLLRYFAGKRREDGAVLQYSAIINLRRARVVAIEPYAWGEKKARWKWGNGRLFVTDPDGVISEVELKKPSRRLVRKSDSPWDGNVSDPAKRREWARKSRYKKKQYRPRKRPVRQKSILDWLFD